MHIRLLKSLISLIAVWGGALLLSWSTAHAATITVTTGVDLFNASAGAGCSLRDAIQAANINANFGDCIGDGAFGSDVVVFAAGISTVTLTNTITAPPDNDNNAYLDLDILVDDASASGGVTLTIDGGPGGVVVQPGVPTWDDRIFDIVASSATTASVVLRNLTIQGGLVPPGSSNETGNSADSCFGGGGGVRNRSGGLMLQNVIVQVSAAATRGGGVCHQSGGALVIEGSQLLTNTANAGGGLWEAAASLMMQSSELRGNTAISGVGGGMVTVGGVATKVISSSLIAFNWAEGDGGGIHNQATTELRLESSVVLSNTAGMSLSLSASGGGIWSSGSLVLSNTAVLSNRALVSGTAPLIPPPGGGGIHQRAASLHVVGGAISNNEVRSFNIAAAGGGLWISGTGQLSGTVVAGNRAMRDNASVSAQVHGGGIYATNSSLTLTQVLIQANTADGFRANGGGVASVQPPGGSSQLVVRQQSRVVSNTAQGDFSVFGGATGGGIESAWLQLEDSEVSYNLAHGGSAIGGGLASYGVLTMTRAQVVSNTATAPIFASGGGINTIGQSALISETQVLSNTAVQGGGWFNQVDGAHMHDSVVRFNRAFYAGSHPKFREGGGIYNAGDNVLVRSAVIGDNLADDRGGGAYNDNVGRLTLLDVVLEDNSSLNGGGLFSQGHLRVERSVLAHNIVSGAGGGAYNDASGTLESISSTLRNNSAALGGGLYNDGQAKFLYSALVSNVASSLGGGAYNAAALESINSTFSANGAPNGGGLRNVGGTAYLTHTTVASNTQGAGVSLSSGLVQVASALLAYNAGGNCNTALTGVGNSLSSDATCGVTILNTNPLLQPLALNGGPTLNHALSAGSPAINAAIACGASDDQRGVPRPQGLACDLGAFERELPDLAVSKSVQPVPALAGQPVTYTVLVTNLSPLAPASSIVLTETLEGNAIFQGVVNSGGFALSSSTFTQAVFSLISLPAGGSTALVFTATAPVSGIFTNTVHVASADVDANPADNVFTITTPVTGAVNLWVKKFATPSPALPGQDVFYVVTLKNLGSITATNVVITDVFQGSGVTFVGVAGLSAGVSLQGSSTNGVTFTLASLSPLGTAVMIYKVNTSLVGVITNTVTASADEAEVDPADNSATVFTLVSHLVVDKAVNTAGPLSSAVAPGGTFTYTLAVSLLGPGAASNVIVTDVLPAGVGFVSALGFGWTCSESALIVTCTRPTLSVGTAPPIQIAVTAPVTAGMVLANTATVTSVTYPAVVSSNSVGVKVKYRTFAPLVRKAP
ncbi:MAG: hypothetical protein KatS3mg052_2167 [Candidatus Roseilinea sp.]|nr:MAG: hypothetical protein KatS3mg052_2167 [Candidatus Roseilinea sp.]